MADEKRPQMSAVKVKSGVPHGDSVDHPSRPIRDRVNRALVNLDSQFARIRMRTPRLSCKKYSKKSMY